MSNFPTIYLLDAKNIMEKRKPKKRTKAKKLIILLFIAFAQEKKLIYL